jgi:hypothetical protein
MSLWGLLFDATVDTAVERAPKPIANAITAIMALVAAALLGWAWYSGNLK